jgi:hypothetical protein
LGVWRRTRGFEVASADLLQALWSVQTDSG